MPTHVKKPTSESTEGRPCRRRPPAPPLLLLLLLLDPGGLLREAPMRRIAADPPRAMAPAWSHAWPSDTAAAGVGRRRSAAAVVASASATAAVSAATPAVLPRLPTSLPLRGETDAMGWVAVSDALESSDSMAAS